MRRSHRVFGAKTVVKTMDWQFKCHLITLLLVSGNQFDLLRIGLVKPSDFFPHQPKKKAFLFTSLVLLFFVSVAMYFFWISDESVRFVNSHSLFLFALIDRILHRNSAVCFILEQLECENECTPCNLMDS